MGTGPDEYSVVNITVNIENQDEIDNKEIECLKENYDYIGLGFDVFFRDPSSPCDSCDGTEETKKAGKPDNRGGCGEHSEGKITEEIPTIYISQY